jgi:hypothetical protein
MSDWTHDDLASMAGAVALLEHPGFVVRLADFLGVPIDIGFAMLPADWLDRIHKAARFALERGLSVAIRSLGEKDVNIEASRLRHKLVVAASGAASGAFGLAGLGIELPFSTTVMLRSIAEIARSLGSDLSKLDTRLECLSVLSMGSRGSAGESGYWGIRMAMARGISEAVTFLGERGLVEEGAPPLVRLITSIAARYGMVVGEEAAARALPIVGAVGGATVNFLFMEHFQNVARGHFTVRKMERVYGSDAVRSLYNDIASGGAGREAMVIR